MSLIESSSSPAVLRLNRDLVRTIKRGHSWVYANNLRDLPAAPPGRPAVLLDSRKGEPIARGFYDPGCPVALRICETDPKQQLDDRWAARKLREAIALRNMAFSSRLTTGFRLFNGEGDGVPGLVVDLYGDTAVLKLDGDGPAGFWKSQGIADWLESERQLACVYERQKERGAEGRCLVGVTPDQPVQFLEHGISFTADVVRGQKTGFFLDQRDNRKLIHGLAKDAKVLNVFSYTGGFSVAAALGGAAHVTSVDIAEAAMDIAEKHWDLNGLQPSIFTGVVADAFLYLEVSAEERRRWDIVILDPPSFAPNRDSVSKATVAYESMVQAGARVTAKRGLLAAASCSSHIDLPLFLQCCQEGISKARRRATVVTITGQPIDHPSPLELPEFRYLKFVLLRLD